MANAFLERLANGLLLADGAMGTELYADGIPFERNFDELNVTNPTVVQAVHRRYIAAGAELIETNTFGANPIRLAQAGLKAVRDINFRAVKLAREAREEMGEPTLIGAAIGPIGQELTPVGRITLDEARSAFSEQVLALLEAGPDVMILETFSDIRELREAILAVRQACDLPIMAQMTFTADGLTPSGDAPADVARTLEAFGVDVLGINCGVGPQVALDVATAFRKATRLPVSAQPNAGFPGRVDGRIFYMATPAYLADYARRFQEAGVSLIGGCCGTTPAHISAMQQALVTPNRLRRRPAAVSVLPREPQEPRDASSPEQPTLMAELLADRKFVVSVEVDPPKGSGFRKVLEGAQMLKDAGAHLLDIGDSPMARIRMSALAMAILIQQQVGIETMIHLTTRDRTLMALQSDLLGAHALGVRNVLALTGDPIQGGNYPHTKGVWDVDSIGLVEVMARLNRGVDSAGASIGNPTSFHIGCAVTPINADWPREHERLKRKLEAGAHYVMTQPLFDMEQLETFLENVGVLSVPIVLGVLPLQSSRHAEFMHNEVAGIEVPAWVRERMRQAGDRGQAEGLAIASEFLELAKPYVQGIYIIPSFGRYEVARDLVAQVVGSEARGAQPRTPAGRA